MIHEDEDPRVLQAQKPPLTPEADEPTYTLEEARRLLQQRECATYGHDLDIVVEAITREPTGATCACGRGWDLVPKE